MQTGKTLSELAAEVERQNSAKMDFVTDTREIEMRFEDNGDLDLVAQNVPAQNGGFDIGDTAHQQIGARVGIPAKYYQRMQAEAPGLLAWNVNHWFHEKPERRMVRTLDGRARAFLSDRYQRLDNYELLTKALPVLSEIGDVEVRSSEITERRMYLQIVTPRVQAEVTRGDVVQAGVVLRNSEIGLGSVAVEQLVYRLVCLNGMIRGHALRKYHVGTAQDEGVLEVLSEEALRADDNALALKLRDVMKAALTETALLAEVEKLREATERRIEGNPAKAAEVLTAKVGLTQTEGGVMLRHLVEGGDLSAWGLANAVTRLAHDATDYDRSIELEQLGGRVIDLPKRDWQEIALAA